MKRQVVVICGGHWQDERTLWVCKVYMLWVPDPRRELQRWRQDGFTHVQMWASVVGECWCYLSFGPSQGHQAGNI